MLTSDQVLARSNREAVSSPQDDPGEASAVETTRIGQTGQPGETGHQMAIPARLRPADAPVDNQDRGTGGKLGRSHREPVNAKKCQLPGCSLEFTPVRSAKDQRFCSEAHRAIYWKLAANIGDKLIREGRYTILDAPKRHVGKGILEILGCIPNEWVPKNQILGGLWNSRRITDLRAKGHLIEHRMFQGESQYRLVVAE